MAILLACDPLLRALPLLFSVRQGPLHGGLCTFRSVRYGVDVSITRSSAWIWDSEKVATTLVGVLGTFTLEKGMSGSMSSLTIQDQNALMDLR